jgi:adenosylhomocysteine nucleosidase
MTLAIVSALIEEQTGLRQRLENSREVRLASRIFLLGQLNGRAVILALCGIGKVAAATTTTLLIDRLGVSEILFTGVAGGVHERAQVGDVVVATELLQHDMDASPIVPQYAVPLTGLSRFSADPYMTQSLSTACAVILTSDGELEAHLQKFRPNVRGKVIDGLIISGDQFIKSHEQSDDLRRRLPDALAVEMEGAAVAQVCHDHGTPFAVMRTISDRADATAHIDFLTFVHEVASLYSERIVLNWLSRRNQA